MKKKTLPLLLCLAVVCLLPSYAQGQLIYALRNGNSLISFRATSPATISTPVPITGITFGQSIEGMDIRPINGMLYALGYNKIDKTAQLYTLNTSTGAATAVNPTPITLNLGTGDIGFDFNPIVDRIRVVGTNDMSYRLNPTNGSIAATDAILSYEASDPSTGKDPSVIATAYSNNYISSSVTTLYAYDLAIEALAVINPPNAGILNTIGGSAVLTDVSEPSVDMDILFHVPTGRNIAYLATNPTGALADNLYTLDLATGKGTLVGKIGTGEAISDIAVAAEPIVLPVLTGQLIYGLSGNALISFDSKAPKTIRQYVGITGLASGQQLVGLDFRPVDGKLYALGYNSTTSEAQLHLLNEMTAVATAIGTPITLALGNGPVSFDVNPTVDRIRVIGSNGNTYRLNPTTGAILATDVSLAYASGDPNVSNTPFIGSAAYTNSFAGSTTTTLYDYDDVLNVLSIQNPPNAGLLNTVGASGLSLNSTDRSSDLDIFFDNRTQTNVAYFIANTGNSTNDSLYTMNLSTGKASAVGRIGEGIAVADIAVSLDVVVTRLEYVETTEMEALTASPNPMSNETLIKVATSKSALARVSITPVNGSEEEYVAQQQVSQGLTTLKINTQKYPAGAYLIRLYLDNALAGTLKVVK